MPRGKKAKDYPYWAYPTRRAYRAAKRADLARLERAIRDVALGCAYLPGPPIGVIETWINEKRTACSVKRWGRG